VYNTSSPLLEHMFGAPVVFHVERDGLEAPNTVLDRTKEKTSLEAQLRPVIYLAWNAIRACKETSCIPRTRGIATTAIAHTHEGALCKP
jgi:hypothetical protein